MAENEREFHVSKRAREHYGLNGRIFTMRGNAVFADYHACRVFASRMNRERSLAERPESAIRASDIYAAGLIEEIMHYVVQLYREAHGGDKISGALQAASERLTADHLDTILRRYLEEFPPEAVRAGELSPDAFLATGFDGVSGREIALEELMMLRLENRNPAYAQIRELFDDRSLRESSEYLKLIEELDAYFAEQPPFGPESEPLPEMLSAPQRHHPDSVYDQLAYIREHWGHLIGHFLFRILRGMDFLKEEHTGGRPFVPGETYVLEYGGESAERYSPDRDWMPNVVLLAKSTLVWLDQLSRWYGREVRRLDQIPDEELDRIAARGFTGLWLIGLWERSVASKRIKRMCGNPEAESSAYALHDYEIAENLGGWNALDGLRSRCEQRGIRLASDMVPNHTGIDSSWVMEHPDRFLQLTYSPFPGYSFSGENLSWQEDVGIYLEDHYYDRTDAAVVFKRVDFRSGEERFIYHGNDGTSMPWNDTAQLDFLNPNTRESVIQTILNVARNFSIIRFDAAMTLAKKHIHRLWFPPPGSGGAIASRAEHGMSWEEFERAMPQEFWREVVDRVAAEAPDTLLLAEAFWMMEGYFVRTLGMHRVYNSAFMHMLKDEENDKYRKTMKNTLEFDPRILKRFVNFMNNPDEETAIAQFGSGDKYFGVCTLMVTMPGLPMFGHGQIEGFAEKYGMEYSRAYWDERPNQELIGRHEREIFPLMRRRWLFAEVDSFYLYDFYDHRGIVNENVFAYTNRAGRHASVVFYNNAYETVSGTVHTSSPVMRPLENGDRHEDRRTIGQALELTADENCFVLMREQRSGLWFIRNSRDLHETGLTVILSGYEAQVYLDLTEVRDSPDGHYRRLSEELAGTGVPDVDEALKELFLRPLHEAFAHVAASERIEPLRKAYRDKRRLSEAEITALCDTYGELARYVLDFSGHEGSVDRVITRFRGLLEAFDALVRLESHSVQHEPLPYTDARNFLFAGLSTEPARLEAVLGYVLVAPLAELEERYPEDERLLLHDLDSLAQNLMLTYQWQRCSAVADRALEPALAETLQMATAVRAWPEGLGSAPRAGALIEEVLEDQTISDYLRCNTYEGVVWFSREAYRELLWWLVTAPLLERVAEYQIEGAAAAERVTGEERLDQRLPEPDPVGFAANELRSLYETVSVLRRAEASCNYRVDWLLEAVEADRQRYPGVTADAGGAGSRAAGSGRSGAGASGSDVTRSGASGSGTAGSGATETERAEESARRGESRGDSSGKAKGSSSRRSGSENSEEGE